jgi:hypothetical protein
VNIFYKIFFSSVFVFTIVSAANVLAMDSLSEKIGHEAPFEFVSETTDQEELESVTKTATQYCCAIKEIDKILSNLINVELNNNGLLTKVFFRDIQCAQSEVLDPCWGQTAQGIFLIVQNSKPHSLWIPWGEYKLLIGQDESKIPWTSIIEKFFKLVSVKFYKEYVSSAYKNYSFKVYEVLSIYNRSVPKAIECEKQEWMAPSLARYVWSDLECLYSNHLVTER